MQDKDDLVHSFHIGEIAFKHLKSRKLAAYPRNYEVLYSYASGRNTKVSDAINTLIEKDVPLNQDHIDTIFEEFISTDKLGDNIDSVGGKILDQIDQLVGLVGHASGQAGVYGQDLAKASTDLQVTTSPEALRAIIETMVQSTRAVEANNRRLQKRLGESLDEIKSLRQSLDQVRAESMTDQLTTLWNRKFYNQSMSRTLADAVRDGQPVSLMVADVDNFKKFNDTYGHLTGDQVLRLVGQALKHNVKGRDIACRYGGEEFVVILPETPLRAAVTVADHIRRSIMGKELIRKNSQENLGRITISIGVAGLREGDTASTFYDRADRCLYAAKRAGRNRVVCENDPEMEEAAKVA